MDEHFNQLDLLTGESTVLQLKISNMRRFSKVIRVASDHCLDYFPNNAPHNFKIKLNRTLKTPSEKYEIALDSMFYFNDVLYRPPKQIGIKMVRRKNQVVMQDTIIHHTDFRTKQTLIKALNRKMSTEHVLFKIDELGKVTIHNTNTFEIDLYISSAIAYVLGEESIKDIESGSMKIHLPSRTVINPFRDVLDLGRIAPQTLMLFCDIIKPVITGSTQKKVIKAVPFEYTESKRYIHYTAKHLDFFTIDPPKFTEIALHMKLISGHSIHFDSKNPVYCTFQVRRKINRY